MFPNAAALADFDNCADFLRLSTQNGKNYEKKNIACAMYVIKEIFNEI